jgi:hypothetical protein
MACCILDMSKTETIVIEVFGKNPPTCDTWDGHGFRTADKEPPSYRALDAMAKNGTLIPPKKEKLKK